jgi:hypothetical protein
MMLVELGVRLVTRPSHWSGVGARQPLHGQLVERCPLDPGRSGLGFGAEATRRKPALEAPPAMLELASEVEFVES